MAALTIRGTVDATGEASEEIGPRLSDPELLGPLLASGVIQTEGALYFLDDYEPLLLGYIFARIAYAGVWMAEDSAKLEAEGKFEAAERVNDRADLLFTQALTQTKRVLRLRDDGFDAAMAGGLQVFMEWIDDHFYTKEDAEVLLTCGLGYFVGALSSDEGLAGAVDIPYARYMIERSIQLDGKLNGSLGLMIIGLYECTMPKLMGGKPDLGMKLLNLAITNTKRQSHGHLVAMAERCAVGAQDRKMFHALLMEVIEAGDVPKYRLTNKLARHRAERLLGEMDELFYE